VARAGVAPSVQVCPQGERLDINGGRRSGYTDRDWGSRGRGSQDLGDEAEIAAEFLRQGGWHVETVARAVPKPSKLGAFIAAAEQTGDLHTAFTEVDWQRVVSLAAQMLGVTERTIRDDQEVRLVLAAPDILRRMALRRRDPEVSTRELAPRFGCSHTKVARLIREVGPPVTKWKFRPKSEEKDDMSAFAEELHREFSGVSRTQQPVTRSDLAATEGRIAEALNAITSNQIELLNRLFPDDGLDSGRLWDDIADDAATGEATFKRPNEDRH
jgi:hypothetical protein